MYNGYAPFADMGLGFLYFVIAVIILIFILEWTSPRKTQRYRKELTDLYVAARIKQIAAKDNVNLELEYEAYKKWRRNRRREDHDLDESIEDDLKDKLEEQQEKAKEKKN